MKTLRSLLKLLWIVLRDAALVVAALARLDFPRAAERTRLLANALLEDALKAVALAQRLVPLWRKPGAATERILVVKLDRIGDMVNTTPVFDVLRRHFPRARIDLLAHPVPLSLLAGDERIAERIAYRSWLYHALPILPPGPRTWLLLLKLLWRRYQLVVYLRGSFSFLGLALTSRFAAAHFVPGLPVIRRYLRPLEELLGPFPHPRPRLPIREADAEWARGMLGADGPAVAIHAGAAAATKVWPAERFAALADRLAEEYGARVHFLGGPADKPTLDRIAALAGTAPAYHHTLPLPRVVALIAACDLFIGNDSGLSHVAAAVGTPLVVLWSAADLGIDRPAAPPEQCRIVVHDLPCRAACPVLWCNNPRPMECLTSIGADEVLDAVRRHAVMPSV